jgi:hypothetical protein
MVGPPSTVTPPAPTDKPGVLAVLPAGWLCRLAAVTAPPPDPLRDHRGQRRPAPCSRTTPYQPVLLDKDAFFAESMCVVEVEGWPQDVPTLQGPVTAPAGEMPAPLSPQVAEREVPAPAPEASGEALAEASSQAAEREAPSPARQQAEQPGPAPVPDAGGEAETSAPAQVNGRPLAAPHPLDEAPTPTPLGLHASAAVPEDQHILAAASAPSAAPPPAAPSDAAPAPHSPTNGNGPIPTPARVAGRARRSPMATPASTGHGVPTRPMAAAGTSRLAGGSWPPGGSGLAPVGLSGARCDVGLVMAC